MTNRAHRGPTSRSSYTESLPCLEYSRSMINKNHRDKADTPPPTCMNSPAEAVTKAPTLLAEHLARDEFRHHGKSRA